MWIYVFSALFVEEIVFFSHSLHLGGKLTHCTYTDFFMGYLVGRSVYLFLWNYHDFRITIPLKSVYYSSLTPYLQEGLGYLGLLVYIWILGLLYFFFYKYSWSFDSDHIEFVIHFGYCGYFNNMDFSNPWTFDIFWFISILICLANT